MTKPTYDDLFNTLNALQRDVIQVYHALKRKETPTLSVGHWQRAYKAQCMCTPENIRVMKEQK